MTIDLYTWKTPNGRKVSIMLEELGLDYNVHTVNIGKDEQFDPDFLKISPNNKIPAIVDPDGPDGQPISVFETGAIMIYLAEKTGQLLPANLRDRTEVIQWLMWQMGGFGPMLGQAHHFLRFAPEEIPYAQKRYKNEALRLYGVLDKLLSDRDYMAASGYSIADIATYPWAMRHEWQQVDLADFPNVEAWTARLGAREAVKKGMATPA